MEWSPLAEAVYRRTYSRPIEDRFETWSETVKRVTDHNCINLMEQAGYAPMNQGEYN